MTRPLAVIVSQFPRYDETFILRELVALAEGGEPLLICSLKSCRDRVIHDQATAFLPQTVYAPLGEWRALWKSHRMFLRQDPHGYRQAIGWILTRHWRHPIICAKTLVCFVKAIHFARLCLERGVRRVHAFWATYPATVAYVIHRLTGLPYSASGHAHDLYTCNPALSEKFAKADFILTCTGANQRYLEGLFQRAGEHDSARRPTVILAYHGVDLGRFQPVPKTDGPVCQLLAVGSLLPSKGFETLVEACRLLQARGLPFHCTLAGGGPFARRLRRHIHRAGLQEKVTITGYLSQAQLLPLYQQAHLFVLPLVARIHWGIPNVLIEALATQTPVITCPLPSLPELVIHGESGWVLPEPDPVAVTQAIATLWANPALRQQLALTGYQRVCERFSLAKTGARLRELFREGASEGAGDDCREELMDLIPRVIVSSEVA